MADLGLNPIWSNMSSGASNVETELIGPDYSYADNIQGPSSMGIGSDGTFSQLGRNADGIAYYVEALITGNPPLGNRYFVNTGGTCTASDGQLRSRYNYIDNMSSGAASLPAAISELGSDFNGLIPGVVDDIEGLNPLYLFSAITADASPACDCYQCPVTDGSSGYQFLTPSLSPDFTTDKCTKVDNSNCPAASSSESFTNMNNSGGSIFPTLLAGLGLLYFVFSGK